MYGIFYHRPKMSGHRVLAMKFQNVQCIQMMILDPGFYIFIIEKFPNLKKVLLPKSQTCFSIFLKHPTLRAPPVPLYG